MNDRLEIVLQTFLFEKRKKIKINFQAIILFS